MISIWDFLRDEQNREALTIVGGLVAALALAGWAVYKEFRASRRLRELAEEVDRIKVSQEDILRSLERAEQRHDLLFGVIVARALPSKESMGPDERPNPSEQ